MQSNTMQETLNFLENIALYCQSNHLNLSLSQEYKLKSGLFMMSPPFGLSK